MTNLFSQSHKHALLAFVSCLEQSRFLGSQKVILFSLLISVGTLLLMASMCWGVLRCQVPNPFIYISPFPYRTTLPLSPLYSQETDLRGQITYLKLEASEPGCELSWACWSSPLTGVLANVYHPVFWGKSCNICHFLCCQYTHHDWQHQERGSEKPSLRFPGGARDDPSSQVHHSNSLMLHHWAGRWCLRAWVIDSWTLRNCRQVEGGTY